jgi:hypothetical protein
MANNLNENIEGKYIIIEKESLKPEFHSIVERVFFVKGGFGAHAVTMGGKIGGYYVCDGESKYASTRGHFVERYATNEEIEMAKNEFKKRHKQQF